MTDGYLVSISELLLLKINNWHAEHPGESLTLSGDEIGELAGCACHGDEEKQQCT